MSRNWLAGISSAEAIQEDPMGSAAVGKKEPDIFLTPGDQEQSRMTRGGSRHLLPTKGPLHVLITEEWVRMATSRAARWSKRESRTIKS